VYTYQSMLNLYIISPVFLLLNILIEIFLLASRSSQNIRRQYRVSVYQYVLYLHIISPVFLLINILIEIFLLASSSFQNIQRQYRVGRRHRLINYKEDIKTKCHLYWCLIEFIDWRYSQSR
jgi:hypothetical protein